MHGPELRGANRVVRAFQAQNQKYGRVDLHLAGYPAVLPGWRHTITGLSDLA